MVHLCPEISINEWMVIFDFKSLELIGFEWYDAGT